MNWRRQSSALPSFTFREMELFKKECHTKFTMVELVVCSMWQSMLSVWWSTKEYGMVLLLSSGIIILQMLLLWYSVVCSFDSGRIIAKKINVRVEHIKHSNCRLDFLKRMKENDQKRKEAKAKGERVSTKRQPVGPRSAHFVSTRDVKPEIVTPIRYQFIA